MHAKRTVDEALSLAAAGLPATRIAQRLGVPRSTVRDWVNAGCPPEKDANSSFAPKSYSFSNRSADIRGIFCMACRRLGLHWTSAPYTIYVSRVADVGLLDDFVGPKA
jgi:transposase